jgi:hypothetical protein
MAYDMLFMYYVVVVVSASSSFLSPWSRPICCIPPLVLVAPTSTHFLRCGYGDIVYCGRLEFGGWRDILHKKNAVLRTRPNPRWTQYDRTK